MAKLIPVREESDILPEHRGTPIADLLRWHNLGEAQRECAAPELLIGMCMDHRKALKIPNNFAFIIRTGGANLKRVEFKVSFAIAIGGVRAIALIGHSRCGMENLSERREAFIRGLVEGAGWNAGAAGEHFDAHIDMFAIRDAAEFVRDEAERLNRRYPKIHVGALFYDVDDGLLGQVVRDDARRGAAPAEVGIPGRPVVRSGARG